MQKILLPAIAIGIGLCSTSAQEITTLRMGPFKLGSTSAEIETAAKIKIRIKPKKDNDFDNDTVNVIYKNATYRLVFSQEGYQEKSGVMTLFSVYSANTSFKTKSNIGLGNNKAQILSAYDKYDNIYIYDDPDYKDKDKGVAKDKVQYIELGDAEMGSVLIFTTADRKVTAIEISYRDSGD